MPFNKLLQKQIKKHLPDGLPDQEWFMHFVQAINDSYEAYERDRVLSNHAFKISEQEYTRINEKLKEEVGLKKSSILQLKEAISNFDELHGLEYSNNDDLSHVVDYLRKQLDEKRKSEILLKQSEKRLRLALQTIEDNVWEYDFETRKMIFAQTETSILKLSRNEYIGDENAEWWKSIYEEDIIIAIDILQKYIRGEISKHSIEYRMYCRDGSLKWILNRGGVIQRDGNGKIIKVIGSLTDIDKLKRAEEKILQSELRLRTALEKIGDNVWEYNFTTGETYFSNTQNHLLGFSTDEYSSNAAFWEERIYPEDRKLLENNEQSYRNGAIDHHLLEYRVNDKNGSIKWVLDRGVVIEKNADGKPLRIIGTHTDITQRKLAEEAIARSEEKYRGIIANMNLGLLEVDMEENIQYSNHSFCEMSGYAIEELIGKKASFLFLKGERSELMETKNDLRKKGVSDAYEMAVKNKRGQLKWWLISGAPRYNDKGDLVGTIGIHLDITDQKQLELDLVFAREAAEESAKSKEVFLANMSHEIRTPMNAILGMSRQLASTPLNDKQQFYLQTINTAGEHLLVVINDILDISKIEAGKLQLEKIGFRFREALEHCILVMVHRAEEKGLDLSIVLDEKISPVLMGDPYRLNQVLLNLLSNAIKFTEKGSVCVNCRLESEKEGRQWISIIVEDTGMGMDENFLVNLFQKFSQEDKTTARKFGGTGLGMSISKQLIELMDGRITVESRKGEGTSISILIPFFSGTEDDIPKQVRDNTDSSILHDKRILLVEDNEMNRLVATTILKKYGTIITEVVNGKEAINELSHSEYDIVLMDIQMPVMDGLEATAIIRKELKNEIPVIALTANAIKGESERCISAGMNDYVSKPFEEEDLISAIAHWLGKTLVMEKKTLPETERTGKLYDLSRLVKISGGNKEFIIKMTTLFAEQTPLSVREIREAYKKSDFATVRSVAHRIRPGIDNMGINILYQDVRDIELLAYQEPDSSRLEGLIGNLEQVIDKVVGQLRQEV